MRTSYLRREMERQRALSEMVRLTVTAAILVLALCAMMVRCDGQDEPQHTLGVRGKVGGPQWMGNVRWQGRQVEAAL